MELINYFNNFWRVIWQNSFFHWAALILLGVAVYWEYNSVKQYERYLISKNRIIQEAIAYLSKTLSDVTTIKGRVELQPQETSPENWRSLLNWFSEYLVGDLSFSGNTYLAEIQNGRFFLLQYPEIFTRSIPRSQWRFVPTLLIAIGVLGTFYGIQTGLQDINLGSLENTQQLLPSIRQLLEGMKTAFSTSLMGLTASSIFTLILAWSERKKQQNRDILRSKLDKIATLQSTGQMFARLQPDTNREAAIAISSAAEIMKTGFAEIIEAQRQLNSQAIGEQVGIAMIPVFQSIRQELGTLREIKADQGQEILNNLIQSLRTEVIEPVVVRLDQSAQLTQEASLTVRELKNELGGISQNLADSIRTIQNFQQDTVRHLHEFAISLPQILDQFQTDTQGVLQQIATEIRASIEGSISGIKAQRTALQESAQEIATTFRGIKENLIAALQVQAQQEQKILEGVQERMMDLIKATHTHLDSSMANVCNSLQETSNVLRQLGNYLVAAADQMGMHK